jgi:hypothetical protein
MLSGSLRVNPAHPTGQRLLGNLVDVRCADRNGPADVDRLFGDLVTPVVDPDPLRFEASRYSLVDAGSATCDVPIT